MQDFLLFFDRRFEESAKAEIEERFGGAKLRDLGSVGAVKLAMITVDASGEEVGRWIRNRSTFIENAVLLLGKTERDGEEMEYDEAAKFVAALLPKKGTMMLEALNFNSGTGVRAKEIEIGIGSRLEKLGFVCDLKKPDRVYYLIITKGGILAGSECGGKPGHMPIDSFRQANKTIANPVSRAEFKLAEAFEFFGIDTRKIKIAADLGAAPGGWTALLVAGGAQIMAVDSAALDVESIGKRIGRKVLVVDRVEALGTKFDILNIRSLAQDAPRALFEPGILDALLIDVNFGMETTARLAAEYSIMLKKGAYLIATLKLHDMSEIKDIGGAEKIINESYENVRVRKMPHNRSEVTCFALKR